MNLFSNTIRTPKCRPYEYGSMTVEAALVLPILLIIFIAVADFGRVFYWSLALSNAARVGAEYGAIDTIHAADEAGMAARAVIAASNDIGVANIINGLNCVGCSPGTTCQFLPQTTANPCLCLNIATMSESIMASCTASCNGIVHFHVNVQCLATFRTISSYLGLPKIDLIRTTRMRVQ